MLTTATIKFLKHIKSNHRGQAVFEYLLIVVMVLGLFMAVVRPGIGKLGKKIQDGMNGSFFNTDDSGAGFYYFPVKSK